jgi:hypothetical protein
MMRKFVVTVTRDLTETAHIEMLASTPFEANEKALIFASENPYVAWSPDEGNSKEPYLPDPNSTEEVE